jgi:hypothetical protein
MHAHGCTCMYSIGAKVNTQTSIMPQQFRLLTVAPTLYMAVQACTTGWKKVTGSKQGICTDTTFVHDVSVPCNPRSMGAELPSVYPVEIHRSPPVALPYGY